MVCGIVLDVVDGNEGVGAPVGVAVAGMGG